MRVRLFDPMNAFIVSLCSYGNQLQKKQMFRDRLSACRVDKYTRELHGEQQVVMWKWLIPGRSVSVEHHQRIRICWWTVLRRRLSRLLQRQLYGRQFPHTAWWCGGWMCQDGIYHWICTTKYVIWVLCYTVVLESYLCLTSMARSFCCYSFYYMDRNLSVACWRPSWRPVCKGVFIATQLNSTELNSTQLNSTDPAEQRTAKSVVFLFMTSWPTNWVNWVTTFIDRWQLLSTTRRRVELS